MSAKCQKRTLASETERPPSRRSLRNL
jgi:hypothetical protein